jgi:protocatechuate 3,4-dioxygenase beta subunit
MRLSLHACLFLIIPSLSFCQNENGLLQQVDKQLSTNTKSVTEILQDPAYMKLHSLTVFRDVIKKNAKSEEIMLVNKNEPGTPVTIKVKLNGNRPLNDLLVYVYHTDNRGWYSDTGAHILVTQGDRGHARLFGYLLTNREGSFSFKTIHPQGYPNSDLPQHIHLEVFDKNGANLLVTELLFDDDARLNANARQRAMQEGFVTAKNEGTSQIQQYSYVVKLR